MAGPGSRRLVGGIAGAFAALIDHYGRDNAAEAAPFRFARGVGTLGRPVRRSQPVPLNTHAMNILSIQSWVAYGHVGNASAVFPLQRLGAEVWAVNTVQFSNHTGYGAWTGQVFTGEQVAAVIDGIAARGALARCDAVLSGYMGDAGIGAAILDAVARVRAAQPGGVYCCDPVIGDEGRGVFVRPGIPGLHPRPRTAAGRPRHAQSVRA